MKLADAFGPMQTLFDAASPATLVVARVDGSALVSPVWFRLYDRSFEVVVARDDPKLDHLRRDPRAVLLVFETVPPFRGVRAEGAVAIAPDDGAKTRLAIASRYLGDVRGRAYADLARRPPGFVLRWPTHIATAWDLADKLP
jgi:Pyridoxamine 5'-phosphate oxidase